MQNNSGISLQQSAENKIPIYWVDFARTVGVLLVVLAHIVGWGSGPFVFETFYYTISRLGVPIFFLISGYLLLSKEEDILAFFKNALPR